MVINIRNLMDHDSFFISLFPSLSLIYFHQTNLFNLKLERLYFWHFHQHSPFFSSYYRNIGDAEVFRRQIDSRLRRQDAEEALLFSLFVSPLRRHSVTGSLFFLVLLFSEIVLCYLYYFINLVSKRSSEELRFQTQRERR